MASSPSLRALYKSHHDVWSFPQENQFFLPSTSSAPFKQGKWDKPATTARDDDVSANVVLSGLFSSVLMQYTTAAVAMPWEVGKLLLQVQYVPQELDVSANELGLSTDTLHNVADAEQELSDSEDSYFHDPDSNARRENVTESGPISAGQRHMRNQVDLKTSSSTSFEYVMPVGPSGGVWDMMKRVGRWRSEGWGSLFKGLLTACVTDALSSAVQPLMHNTLVSVFPYTPHSSSLLVPILSHLCTGILLSPLDLVRTRLIAQSALTPFRTYTGPIDALSHIMREEGGLKGLYLHPHLLFPAILESTFRPFITLSFPHSLGSMIKVNEDGALSWMLVEFVAGCAGLLVILPIETIRRRLQIQVRGSAKPLRTCVHTRKKPYHGVVDAFWRIFTEECSDGRPLTSGSDSPASQRNEQTRSQSWYSRHGLGQLYRGFGMGVGAHTLVLVLSLLVGTSEADVRWAEL